MRLLKWMLVTCFGYTGYKNAKFGRIEVHEGITGRSREILHADERYRRDDGVYRAARDRGLSLGAGLSRRGVEGAESTE